MGGEISADFNSSGEHSAETAVRAEYALAQLLQDLTEKYGSSQRMDPDIVLLILPRMIKACELVFKGDLEGAREKWETTYSRPVIKDKKIAGYEIIRGSLIFRVNDVYRNYIDWFCLNGTCDNQIVEIFLLDCGDDYCEDWSEYTCYGKIRKRQRTCYDKGCELGSCYSDIRGEIDMKECEYGCKDGECVDDDDDDDDCSVKECFGEYYDWEDEWNDDEVVESSSSLSDYEGISVVDLTPAKEKKSNSDDSGFILWLIVGIVLVLIIILISLILVSTRK